MTPEEYAIQVWEDEGGFIDLRFDDADDVVEKPLSVEIPDSLRDISV